MNIEVKKQDEDGKHTWQQAMDLGKDGWRLPSKEELNWMYANMDKIGGFYDDNQIYWSNDDTADREFDGIYYAWFRTFSRNQTAMDTGSLNKVRNKGLVRLVRDL